MILFLLGMSTFLFYGCARFRLPLEPFFLLFAASALCRLFRRCRSDWAPSVWIALVVALNGVLYIASEPLREGLVELLRGWGLK